MSSNYTNCILKKTLLFPQLSSEEDREVKKWTDKLLALLLASLLFFALAPSAAAEQAAGEVTAAAYLVLDADTGEVLLEHNGARPYYPASITKVMTLALAMEHCGGDLSGTVTVSKTAYSSMGSGASRAGFLPGEQIRLQDAFYATMLVSGNDAANVLAEYTATTIEDFVQMMNNKAAELGLQNTHFENAHGMQADSHYTSPYDMARLTQWAMGIKGFSQLWGAAEYTMQPTNKHSEPRTFRSDNLMLRRDTDYTYQGCTGGKSGWTPDARFTMVETAARGGRTLVCVVMGVPQQYAKFTDCALLLDRAFAGDSHEPSAAVRSAQQAAALGGQPAGGGLPAAWLEGWTDGPHEAAPAEEPPARQSPDTILKVMFAVMAAAAAVSMYVACRTIAAHLAAALRRRRRRKARRQLAAFARRMHGGAKAAPAGVHVTEDGLFLELPQRRSA